MAGTTLSTLTNYLDADKTHEHTYFGNGNGPNAGLTTVGTTYETTTYDGETQKIGTYYNFQAATIGTGAALTDDGEQAPDSFCPAGWQLPIGDTASVNKSFSKLVTVYALDNNADGSNKIRSYPLSFFYPGSYNWNTGYLQYKNTYGNWWSNTIMSSSGAKNLFIRSSGIESAHGDSKTLGITLRCVSTY